MAKDDSGAGEALNAIIKILSDIDAQSRTRVLNAVSTFFDHEIATIQASPAPTSAANFDSIGRPAFSDERKPSPKDFLFQKQPKTDVERIACLAFYLTHFRDTPHFKTLDLAKLNTEAAQTKFSNATYACDNATKAGYLAPAAKGQKQITAAGEQFVVALPDREAALKIITQARKRRSTRRK